MTNDWEMDHLGIVVRNIDDAMKHYQLVGMELFTSPELETLELNVPEGVDKTSRVNHLEFKSCFIQNQTIRLKLIQPVAGGDLFHDYLNRYGTGANLLVFRVNDLEKEMARLIEMGITVIASAKRQDGNYMEILFDTRKFGNMIIALFSEPAPFPIFKASEGNWKLHHLGLVVKDIDKFAEYYKLIGFKSIGPIREMGPAKLGKTIWTINGKTPTDKIISKGVGPFQNKRGTFLLEVAQPIEGKDLYVEFMEKHGEGVMHVHFLVYDLEKELKSMVARGFPAIMTVRRPDGKLFESFYDTRRIGNLCVALWEGQPPFKAKAE